MMNEWTITTKWSRCIWPVRWWTLLNESSFSLGESLIVSNIAKISTLIALVRDRTTSISADPLVYQHWDQVATLTEPCTRWNIPRNTRTSSINVENIPRNGRTRWKIDRLKLARFSPQLLLIESFFTYFYTVNMINHTFIRWFEEIYSRRYDE